MPSAPVRVALIGAGRIGASHANVLARRVPDTHLVAVADPRPGAAAVVADQYGARSSTSPEDIIGADDVDAVVIAASSTVHAGLIAMAASAGKHVFSEKPAGMTLAEVDGARAATGAAGVVFQVGFNRRFARDFIQARDAVDKGQVGQVQLMRSLTRDPGSGPADPGAVPLWTIFTQTLIHDFDTLNWLNPGARAVDVIATADALIAPDFRGSQYLDTAVVVIRYSNGAMAVAEASFAASYGYDVRAEIFGSRGMATMGDGATSSLRLHNAAGRVASTSHSDTDLLIDAYTGEFNEFAAAILEGRPATVGGDAAFAAFAIAQACIDSMETGNRSLVPTEVAR